MSGTKVTINGNRILKVNGKPFFPIGARHIPAGADMKILKEVGFNCFRWTAFGTDTAVIKATELPSDLEGLLFYAYIFNRGDFSENTETRKKDLTKLVLKVKKHSAFLCYEQENEPSSHLRYHSRPKSSPEAMQAGSAFIRQLDSDHPIRIGHSTYNLISTLRKYNGAVDIIGCNPYVINHPEMRAFAGFRPDGKMIDSPNQTLSAVGDYTTKMMKVAEGRPVWMMLQAMANEDWYNAEHMPELEGTGIYEHHKIYPSYWQMRFMFFNSVVRGTTGVEWALLGTDINSSAWLEVKKILSELSRLQGMLCAPVYKVSPIDVQYKELGFSDWTGVELLLKKYRDKVWIIAVNTQFDPMETTFSKLPPEFGGLLDVYGEERKVCIKGGGFTDRFQPYEVHIYCTEGC